MAVLSDKYSNGGGCRWASASSTNAAAAPPNTYGVNVSIRLCSTPAAVAWSAKPVNSPSADWMAARSACASRSSASAAQATSTRRNCVSGRCM